MAGQEEVLLKYSHDGQVATIVFNRPNRGNSLNPALGALVVSLLQKLEEDVRVRVLVVTGNGKYFCTGMDLSSGNQENLSSQLQSGKAAEGSLLLFEAFRNFKKPIISRINGPAMGGGWGLLFTTDIRIASSKSFFWFAEIKRGIVPALISAYIVPEIGAFKAKQLFLTGQKVSPKEALSLGLITAVANDENDGAELDTLVEKYIQQILEGGPGAAKSIKALVNDVSGATHERNLEIVKKVFSQTVQSEEAVYGVSCFIQKEKPDWLNFVYNKPNCN